MLICNDCGRTFETPETSYCKVPYGNTYVDCPEGDYCPHCKGNIIEIVKRDKDDPELFIDKEAVIDFAVSVLACLNAGYSEKAREKIKELICEIVPDDIFDYKDSLDNPTTQSEADSLLGELMEILEVKTV